MKLDQAAVGALNWRDVDSSNVTRIAWCESGHQLSGRPLRIENENDEVLGALYVQFRHGGRIYRYLDVDQPAALSLVEAKSVGQTLNAVIKGSAEYESIEIEGGQ